MYMTVTPDSHLVIVNAARDTLWKSSDVVQFDSAGVAGNSWTLNGLDSADIWQRISDSIAAHPGGSGDSSWVLAEATTLLTGNATEDTSDPAYDYTTFLDLMDSVGFYATNPPIAGWGVEIHDDTAGNNRISVNRTDTDTAYAPFGRPDTIGTRAWGDGIWLALAGKAADATKSDSALVSASTHALPDSNPTVTVLNATRGRFTDIFGALTGKSTTSGTADTTAGGSARATLAANATKAYNTDSVLHYSGAKFPRRDTVNPFTAQYYSTEVRDSCTIAAASTATVNWATSNVHWVALDSGANTLTLTNPGNGGRYLLLLKQPSSGAAGTVTFSPVPLWPSATAPTLSTTNNYLDIVTLAYSGIEAKYVGAAALDLR
jgi:hypothetical protein